MTDSFDDALAQVRLMRGSESSLVQPIVKMLSVEGAAVSTFGRVLPKETVSASDRQAHRIDELQFDLGEGPCWDALAEGRPVLEPDIRSNPRRHWPAFSRAILELPVGALFAFPLSVGPLRLGALDLYTRDARELTETSTDQATSLAAAVSKVVLRRAVRDLIDDEHADNSSVFSRRRIHQATGIVIGQLRLSADDAELVLQGHAFAAGKSMAEIADDVIERRLRFEFDEGDIEVSR